MLVGQAFASFWGTQQEVQALGHCFYLTVSSPDSHRSKSAGRMASVVSCQHPNPSVLRILSGLTGQHMDATSGLQTEKFLNNSLVSVVLLRLNNIFIKV